MDKLLLCLSLKVIANRCLRGRGLHIVGPLGLVEKSSYGFIGSHQGLTDEFQGL